MRLWTLRVLWATLPLTVGVAVGDATRPWDDPIAITATALLAIVWLVGLLAVALPQPIALTAIRTAAPLALVVAVATLFADGTRAATAWFAIVVALATALLAGSAEVSRTCAQASAYGDEERFPLKVPPALFLGILPLAVLVVGAGIAAGPLLIAADRLVVGIPALVVGWALAALIVLQLHRYSLRWAVLVPAGFVIVDDRTLTDPFLFTREHIVAIGPVNLSLPISADVIDLRLGASRGSLALALDDEAPLTVRHLRHDGQRVRSNVVLLAPVLSQQLLATAAARRIPVHD